MDKPPFFNDLQQKFNQFVEQTPLRDLDKNMKAMMSAQLAKLDVVTREEFEVQKAMLVQARAQLAELEQKVAQLLK
jgi:BMFP domain-containing protein YqiC